jgi:preprotein translocase subunit YajC
MNTSSIILFLAIILIPAILIVILITRMNRSQWRRAQEMQGKVVEFESGFRHAIEAGAIVISNSETIAPNAGGFAKVDLQMEVQIPGKAPLQVSACWLVEVDSLEQVLPGKSVPVKVDPQRPLRVLPNIPWARPWIFGK